MRMMVGLLFACGWTVFGASKLPAPAALVVSLAAVAAAIVCLRAARRRPAPRAGAGAGKVRLYFVLNLVFEIVLLNLAYLGTARAGRADLVVPAISAAVGLHFVPMRWIFGEPRYLYLAIGLVAGAALTAAAVVVWHAPAQPAAMTEAFANGAMLWATVLSALRGRRRG